MIYVLITVARNEEVYIEMVIKSIISQTILPKKWIIVSDGSTDRTDEIVRHYAAMYNWIELIRLPKHRNRSFASLAKGFNLGYQRLKNIEYDVIGKIDADVSFPKDYFEYLLQKFLRFPNLGLAGTPCVEEGMRDLSKSRFYNEKWVNGMCQLFRRECYEDIGEYIPEIKTGVVFVGVITARMKGWNTISFTGNKFYHHRRSGTANRNIYLAKFNYGRNDFLQGSHPLWQLLRGLYQMTLKPYIFGGVLLIVGYIWAFMRRENRFVSMDFVRFNRKEQTERLKALIKGFWR